MPHKSQLLTLSPVAVVTPRGGNAEASVSTTNHDPTDPGLAPHTIIVPYFRPWCDYDALAHPYFPKCEVFYPSGRLQFHEEREVRTMVRTLMVAHLLAAVTHLIARPSSSFLAVHVPSDSAIITTILVSNIFISPIVHRVKVASTHHEATSL